jgi:hypothetical protein
VDRFHGGSSSNQGVAVEDQIGGSPRPWHPFRTTMRVPRSTSIGPGKFPGSCNRSGARESLNERIIANALFDTDQFWEHVKGVARRE